MIFTHYFHSLRHTPALFFWRRRHLVLPLLCFLGLFAVPAFAADTPRQTIVKAMAEDDDEKKIALIKSLTGIADPEIKPLFDLWKEDAVYLYKAENSEEKMPVTLSGEKDAVGSSRVDLQACKLEYSIVSPK